MPEPMDRDAPEPLPRDWLPHAVAPEGAPEWEARLERIVAAAERTLPTWSFVLGSWWRPASALAATAAVLLILGSPDAPRESAPGSLPLTVVAVGGDAFALWMALGLDADPVLALMALQARSQ